MKLVTYLIAAVLGFFGVMFIVGCAGMGNGSQSS